MQPSESSFQVFFRFGNADFTDGRVAADTGTAKEDVADDLDANHIGRTGFGNGDTIAVDDEVTSFDEVIVEGCKDSVIDDGVNVVRFFARDGLDTPVELQATDDGFVRRYGHDRAGRAGTQKSSALCRRVPSKR